MIVTSNARSTHQDSLDISASLPSKFINVSEGVGSPKFTFCLPESKPKGAISFKTPSSSKAPSGFDVTDDESCFVDTDVYGVRCEDSK